MAGSARTREQQRTLVLAAGSTLVALITFVTPLGTVGRTAAALGSGPSTVPWLLSAMSLGLAVALLPAGALADDTGRRRVFVGGLTLMAAGAAMCAAAAGSLVFVIGRLVEGVGGAAVLACGLGLIGHAFPAGPARGHATGVWGASVGGGIALGGLLTVLVDTGNGWRATYAVTAGLSLALALAARLLLVESTAEQRRPPDLLGALLLGAGLTCLLAGLVNGRQGWASTGVLTLLAAGGLLIAAFAYAQAHLASPMLDLALFRRRPFLAATLGALANGAGATALAAYLPTLVQQGLGRSLLVASLLVLLFAGSSIVTALNVKHLASRLPSRWLLVAGLAGASLAQVAQTGLSSTSSVLRLVPGLLLMGVAFGALNAGLGREAVASVPPGRASMGSGANNTARYVGSALGISLVAVLATRGGPAAGADGVVAGWNTAALVTAAISAAGAIAVAALRPAAPISGRNIR